MENFILLPNQRDIFKKIISFEVSNGIAEYGDDVDQYFLRIDFADNKFTIKTVNASIFWESGDDYYDSPYFDLVKKQRIVSSNNDIDEESFELIPDEEAISAFIEEYCNYIEKFYLS